MRCCRLTASSLPSFAQSPREAADYVDRLHVPKIGSEAIDHFIEEALTMLDETMPDGQGRYALRLVFINACAHARDCASARASARARARSCASALVAAHDLLKAPPPSSPVPQNARTHARIRTLFPLPLPLPPATLHGSSLVSDISGGTDLLLDSQQAGGEGDTIVTEKEPYMYKGKPVKMKPVQVCPSLCFSVLLGGTRTPSYAPSAAPPSRATKR